MERLARAWPPVLSFAVVLLVWQGAVWIFRPAPFLLPGLDRVEQRLVEFGPNWPKHVLATGESILLGFLIAVVFGVTAAGAIVHSGTLRRGSPPLLVAL